ncbi:hypothetical protein [Thalassotalea sp. G2M2-11]|uniref:hypothetical protein n=1 Tax=Thalassotalea sp. G2M2-11 TaxID=2787627 RepID=UPI0019D048B6|nr:hypothetical protein [Thalassotalea sp. G2M2-11]
MHLPEQERRQSKDFWYKSLKIIAVLAWLIFIIALFVSYYAAPEHDYGVLRYREITIRKFWLTPLTGYLYVLLWCSAFLSYLCLIINKYRSRRKTDNKHFNFILLFVISVAWIIYIAFHLMNR